MLSSVPAIASDEPAMGGSDQLSSRNRRIEDWSVRVWSTALVLAHGEMTSNGSRGPYPQRPFWPPSGVCAVVSPHSPVPDRKSCGPGGVATPAVLDGLCTP